MKLSENLEIAKKKRSLWAQQLLDRQRQLKRLSDERIAALKLSDPAKKRQQNELLTAILLHDDKEVCLHMF